jgi:hypothetical protein
MWFLSNASHAEVQFRPVRANDYELLYKYQKIARDCWFFRRMSFKSFTATCQNYRTMVLTIHGDIYGLLMYKRAPFQWRKHQTYYVAYRCSFAKVHPQKPVVPIGEVMWSAFVQMLHAAHPQDLIAIGNYSISSATRHHQSNCMEPVSGEIAREASDAVQMPVNMLYMGRGPRYQGAPPSYHRPCLVQRFPGALVRRGVWSASIDQITQRRNELVVVDGQDSRVFLDQTALHRTFGDVWNGSKPELVAGLTADVDLGYVPRDRMSSLEQALAPANARRGGRVQKKRACPRVPGGGHVTLKCHARPDALECTARQGRKRVAEVVFDFEPWMSEWYSKEKGLPSTAKVAVLSTFRSWKRGWGKRSFCRALDYLFAQGFTHIVLHAVPTVPWLDMATLQKHYRMLGFRSVDNSGLMKSTTQNIRQRCKKVAHDVIDYIALVLR